MSHDRDAASAPRRPDPRSIRAAAVIWRDGRLLMLQRPAKGGEPPTWELPSAVVGAWETTSAALVRWLEHVLGVRATVGDVIEIEQSASGGPPERAPEIHFIECQLDSFEFRPSFASQTWRWVRPPDIGSEELAPSVRAFIARLSEL